MTVVGDEIIQNCRECFSTQGYGVKLRRSSSHFECPVDASHRYTIEKGFLKRI